MILVSLEIENYKQFAGHHLIAPTAQGIVGIVGPNGVGKTTLFEAIEWCLYNPTSIRNEDVPPRAGVGHTYVRITLEEPSDDVRWVVERRLRSRNVSAIVYREDEPEHPIVQGSRQVSDYVARRLIGLSHRAFVSTFFTRQKELSFFGGLRETERRREVARLLGLETIRVAQQSIGEERAQAQAEAKSLRAQYFGELDGRDFAAEIGDADVAVEIARGQVVDSEARVVAAGEATSATRAELDRWRAIQEYDNALALELTRQQGELETARTRRENAGADLARIDGAIADRAALAPISAEEPAWAATVAAQEAERERHLSREQSQAERRKAADEIRRASAAIEKAVRNVPSGDGVPAEWLWRAEDDTEPLTGVDRLIDMAAAIDVDSACERETELVLCAKLVQQRDEATSRVARFRTHLDRLRSELDRLLADGDPQQAIQTADRGKESALAVAESVEARLRTTAADRNRLEQIIVALRAADFSHGCPLCARPFTADQVDQTSLILEERVAEYVAFERTATKERDEARALAKRHDAARAAALETASQVDVLRGRVADGETKVAEANEEADERQRECAAALLRSGLTASPTAREIEFARAIADRAQRVAGSLPLLRQLRSTIAERQEEAASAERRLREAGPVDYDPAAHEAAEQSLDEARRAAARIDELDRQIARRPGIEAELTSAMTLIDRVAAECERLVEQRTAIGFDPACSARAIAAERTARETEKAVLDERQAATMALAQTEQRRLNLTHDHNRIASLATKADARGRAADELDRMYREFSRFDQYVAERVTPQLAEHTGELLAAVTEGKYDRVEFDENYGLQIFDGEERFPIGTYSGGERDVAALCARLALSRLVGGQAGHPPEFLVLDEVFGSLDRERRAHVLEMLGTLAGNTDAFRQLFIISHVDDVRASSLFNQVWRLSETEEGVSQFEDITESGGLEEF